MKPRTALAIIAGACLIIDIGVCSAGYILTLEPEPVAECIRVGIEEYIQENLAQRNTVGKIYKIEEEGDNYKAYIKTYTKGDKVTRQMVLTIHATESQGYEVIVYESPRQDNYTEDMKRLFPQEVLDEFYKDGTGILREFIREADETGVIKR